MENIIESCIFSINFNYCYIGMCFLVSGIFSDEFKYKADSVFFAAKLGRSKAIMSKIYAGIGTITAVYWFEVILFTLIVLATLGINGANCLIQTDADNWHSVYNITFFQEYLITVVGAYIGCIFILSLSMLVSIHTKARYCGNYYSVFLCVRLPVS